MLDFNEFMAIDANALRQNVAKRLAEIKRAESIGLSELSLEGMEPHIKRMFLSGDSGSWAHIPANRREISPDMPQNADELNKEYLRLAKKYHPDLNPDDPKAIEKFKEAQAAFEKKIALNEGVEQSLTEQETRLTTHFAETKHSFGWMEGWSSSIGGHTAIFPIDHLSDTNRSKLFDVLRKEGLFVEEHYSAKLKCNVFSITSAKGEPVKTAEVIKKLHVRFKPAAASAATAAVETAALEHEIPLKNVTAKASVSETKFATSLENAAKPAEEALAKADGKAKWIVGGIIAATVAVGAFIAYRKKTAVAREQDRQQENSASRSIG